MVSQRTFRLRQLRHAFLALLFLACCFSDGIAMVPDERIWEGAEPMEAQRLVLKLGVAIRPFNDRNGTSRSEHALAE